MDVFEWIVINAYTILGTRYCHNNLYYVCLVYSINVVNITELWTTVIKLLVSLENACTKLEKVRKKTAGFHLFHWLKM